MDDLHLHVEVGDHIYQFGITEQQAKGMKALTPQVAGTYQVCDPP